MEPGSDAMLRAIVQSSVSPYVVLDPAGTIVWVSERVEPLLGEPAERYVGRHFLEVIDPRSHDVVLAEYAEFNARDRLVPWIGPPVVVDLRRHDGTTTTCEVSAASGHSYGIDGMIVQVRRWRGTILLHQAVDALAVGAPLGDVLSRIVAVTEHDMAGNAVYVLAGWDGERHAIAIAAPETGRADPDLARAVLDACAGHDVDPAQVERLATGAGYATSWVVPVTVRGDDAPSARLVLLRPVPGPPRANHTTLERTQQLVALAIQADRTRREWRRGAVTDHLTGLPNRAGLEEWLAGRDDAPIALLFCDVDGFKAVNDELGHTTGDWVLQVVAGRIRAGVRDGDLVCRWGGDEFIVVCTDPSAAEALAARIIDHVGQPIRIEDRTTQVGVSIGIGFGSSTGLDDVLRASDDALLQAKEQGRRRYVVVP